MASVDQMSSEESAEPPLEAQSDHSAVAWSSCCALKVRHPSDLIQIFHTDDNNPRSDVPKTKFWTGSQADENLLAEGHYVFLEVKKRSSLIFKDEVRKLVESAENPKLLIPLHTAERVGFSRLANVGPVVQKTAKYTYTMEKVDSEEECRGTTAFHMNNEIFRLDTKVHSNDGNKEALATTQSNFSWKLSLLELVSLKMLFIMMLSRYGLSLANEKYGFLENDSIKLWLKNIYTTIVDHFFRTDKCPTWYDNFLSWF